MSASGVAYGARVGSASRAEGSGFKHPRLEPTAGRSDVSSFCLMCAHWHFGSHVERCGRCHSRIFWWVRDNELRLFQRHGSMSGF